LARQSQRDSRTNGKQTWNLRTVLKEKAPTLDILDLSFASPNERRMSPYVVPDHALGRNQQTPSTLIPRFGTTLPIVSFDALGSSQTTGFPDDVSMLPRASSDERVNTSVPDFKSVDVHHSPFFFDDGDITFIVGLARHGITLH
jgi:hypothetical protein